MKKFIASASRQDLYHRRNYFTGEILGDYKLIPYESANNPRLKYDVPCVYPIIPVINGYTEAEDEIEVIVITEDYSYCKDNFVMMKAQIEELCRQKNVTCTVTMLGIEFSESLEKHLNTLNLLIDMVTDNDILHACITYGSKPTPLIEVLALNYAYRIKKNVVVECVVYGEKEFKSEQTKIYDVTALFQLDQIVNSLAASGIRNPTAIIKQLLSDDSAADDEFPRGE